MAITTDVALETMSWVQTYTIARIVECVDRDGGGPDPGATCDERPRPATDRWSGLDRRAGRGRDDPGRILDVVGLVAFAVGLETAPTWMVGLAASLGPAVTIIAAVVFLGERLKPIQWFGLVAILVGMVCVTIR